MLARGGDPFHHGLLGATVRADYTAAVPSTLRPSFSQSQPFPRGGALFTPPLRLEGRPRVRDQAGQFPLLVRGTAAQLAIASARSWQTDRLAHIAICLAKDHVWVQRAEQL